MTHRLDAEPLNLPVGAALEIIVELILELFGEVLLQLVFEALAEVGLHAFRRRADRPPGHPALRGLGYAVLGLIAGALSLLVLPNSLMHTRPGRLACLLLAPVASGLAMGLLGAWRQQRGQAVVGLDRFACGYLFALGMALVRFFGTR
jgi:hypothetical protein